MIRILDFILSLFLIISLSPLFLIVSLINLIINKDIFFITERIGLNGKKINVIKFLTIQNNKILKFGNFFRRTSIDELPQLFNILMGDMSLVGPRPYPIENFNDTNKSDFILRHSIKPGLTGLSQIKFTGKKRTNVEKIKIDLMLVKEFNIIIYLKILALTPKILFLRFLKNKSGNTL